MQNNLKKRKIIDLSLNTITYLASIISVVVLVAILLFVFINGSNAFSFKMLTSDYYETSYFTSISITEEDTFELENSNNIYYSKNFGIGLKDETDFNNEKVIVIKYISETSPLRTIISKESNEEITLVEGQIIKRIILTNTDNTSNIVLPRYGAEYMVQALDNSLIINELYFASMGGGIRGSIITTLYLILLTLVIVIPLGVISALYLSSYAKQNKVTRTLRSLIDMISGIPSIIFGMVCVIIFIPFVNTVFKSNGGSIISGALTMALMLLPVVIRTTEEAINTIPQSYQSASLALGASKTQTTLKIILPNALSGILTSALLAIGRIIGESAALIFAIGTVIKDSVELNASSSTLAVHIWTVMSGENPNYNQACAVSMVILIIVLLLNILVKVIGRKLNKLEVK